MQLTAGARLGPCEIQSAIGAGGIYMTVVADVAPPGGGPNRALSQYEAVVVASVTDAAGNLWQFGFDPEVDVNNNN